MLECFNLFPHIFLPQCLKRSLASSDDYSQLPYQDSDCSSHLLFYIHNDSRVNLRQVWHETQWDVCWSPGKWSTFRKLNGVWSHHFMANRWGNNGNSERLYFGGSKITADGDYSHEIKRHLPLGKKAMTNPDSLLKSWDIILLTMVHLVKAMVFPVVMYRCENWTIKKAER